MKKGKGREMGVLGKIRIQTVEEEKTIENTQDGGKLNERLEHRMD